MSVLDEAQLKLQIKSGIFSSPFLIYGDEEYIKKFYVNQIAEKAVSKDFEAFNLHRYDAKNTTWSEIITSVESIPMFSDYSCVIVEDMPLDNLSQSEQETFENLISDVPSSTILIFWMNKIEVKAAKNAKWKKLVSQFDKYGAVVELNKRSVVALKKLVVSGAKKRNCIISADNAQYLVESVGDDMTNLLNELEKICFFVGEGEITKAHIDEVAVKSVEAVVYDLMKAVNAKKADKAFKILSLLFSQKIEPIMILGVIISSYVDMYRAKLFQKSGFRSEDAAKFFDYKNKEFRLRNALRDSSEMSLSDLRDCLKVLDETDGLMKSSGTDAKTLIEQCITRLIIISNR